MTVLKIPHNKRVQGNCFKSNYSEYITYQYCNRYKTTEVSAINDGRTNINVQRTMKRALYQGQDKDYITQVVTRHKTQDSRGRTIYQYLNFNQKRMVYIIKLKANQCRIAFRIITDTGKAMKFKY